MAFMVGDMAQFVSSSDRRLCHEMEPLSWIGTRFAGDFWYLYRNNMRELKQMNQARISFAVACTH